MQVKVIDVCQNTSAEVYRTTCDLRDCFLCGPGEDDIDEEFHKAINYLVMQGRYYVGGGAAPLVLLMRADR